MSRWLLSTDGVTWAGRGEAGRDAGARLPDPCFCARLEEVPDALAAMSTGSTPGMTVIHPLAGV